MILRENETKINISRDKEVAQIITNDSESYAQFDKFVQENPEDWKVVEEKMLDGKLICKTYECPKSFINLFE